MRTWLDDLRDTASQVLSTQLADVRAGWWGAEDWNALVGTERRAKVDLGTVTYFDFGNRDGATLVLLGGVGMTKTQWDPQFLSDLAADYRLVALDYPGVGTATTERWDDISVESLAEAVFELIQELELGRPNVLGWAFSGKVAALLFVRHGGSLGKYVNLAGRISNTSGHLIPEDDLERLTDANPVSVALRAWPSTPWGVWNAAVVGLRVLSHDQEPRSAAMRSAYARAQRRWQEGGGGLDVTEIRNDTLIVAGDRDDVAPLADMEAAAESMRAAGTNVTFTHYAQASHTVLYQYRPYVVADIRRFLDES